MIFNYKTVQNLVAEQDERDFDMIFLHNAVQNLVAEQDERDFEFLVAEKYERYILT